MKRSTIIFIMILVPVVGIGIFVLKTLHDAGEFKKIQPHFNGKCQAIQGILSSEDITIDPRTGIAFISSDDRRPLFQGDKGRQGAIYAFDLKRPLPGLLNLTADFDREFHPHGIGLFCGQDGGASLFVVNHRQDGHYVEIFDFDGATLLHRRSVEGELMYSPNDVIPVSHKAFYVTNDHGSKTRLGRMLEDYFQLAKSNVLYYDGSRFRVVAEGLAYANGVNISHDGKTVFVAATVGRRVHVYDRDMKAGELTLREVIDTGTGVDNIELDEAGSLWIGCHPKLLTFVKYAKDPAKLAPCQVIRIAFDKKGGHAVEEIYLSEGKLLSGCSVGAAFDDVLLIGSVFDGRFLFCKRP